MIEQQVRELRILHHPGVNRKHAWTVQYGYWTTNKRQRKFLSYQDYPCEDEASAIRQKAKLELELHLSPDLPAPDAKPLPNHIGQVRRLRRAAATDHHALVRRALDGLPDPLPAIEDLHRWMGVGSLHRGESGHQFNLYLGEAAYRRFLAMARAAGITRNQMIEALIYTAGEEV